MLRTKAWFALLLLVIFLPATIMAQEMMHGKWWNNSSIADELKLTKSEKKRLDEKYIEGRRKMIDLKSAVEKERLELDFALERQDTDKTRIKDHYDRLEKARTELSKARFGLLIEMRDIIGIDRFQTLKQMHRSRTRDKNSWNSKGRPSRRERY